MLWIDFANEYEKILDDLVSSGKWLGQDKQVVEGRNTIKDLRKQLIGKPEARMSKYKARQVKELFLKLKA